jgi:uncharacterized protein YycO
VTDVDDKNIIRVLFSRPRGFNIWSSLIRWYMGVPYSHVGIYVYSRYLEMPLIYEASVRGVTLQPMHRWTKKHDVILSREIPVDSIEKRRVIRKAVDRCGVPYGFHTLFGILLRNDLGMDGPKTFICSEFVYDVLKEKIKADLPNRDGITPRELWGLIDG